MQQTSSMRGTTTPVSRFDPAPPPASAADDPLAAQLRRATPSQLALLPIRAFFGVTFLYAGIDKLLDPAFLDPAAPGSIGDQLQVFARVSPLAPLVRLVEPWSPAVGLVVALAEIAIGLGALTGLAFRAAALGGAALSLLFFLTASWTTHPYYYGPDLPYAIGWIALAIGGTGGLLVPRAVGRLGATTRASAPPGALREGTSSAMSEPAASPSRRLLLQAAVLGGLSLIVASVALPVRFARPASSAEGDGAGLSNDGPSAGETTSPGASSTGAIPGRSPAGSPGATAAPFRPTGLAVASIASVDRKGAVSIRIPADAPSPLPAGDPGVIVRLADGRYVCFDAVCTHEGCRVAWDARDSVLLCPCHGAAFDAADHGAVLAGPTNTPLPELPIVVDKVAGTISLRA